MYKSQKQIFNEQKEEVIELRKLKAKLDSITDEIIEFLDYIGNYKVGSDKLKFPLKDVEAKRFKKIRQLLKQQIWNGF